MLNPYEVLGVTKTATQEEIKKSYRNLAKRNHPDLNPGNKKAEEKFKEISHAHDLIGTPEERAKFDSGEMDGYHHQERQQRQKEGRSYGANNERYTQAYADQFAGEDFFENIFGTRKKNPPQKSDRDHYYQMAVSFKESILGSEKVITLPNGKNLQIKIPPGITSGTKLRFKNQGMPGPDEFNHGDAFVEIQVEPLEGWTRHGLDLETEVAISFIEGITGSEISVQTMHGPVMLKIPPGANTGTKLRIKGKGVIKEHEMGNQIIKLKVMLPKVITPELSAAMANLKEIYNYNPRGEA